MRILALFFFAMLSLGASAAPDHGSFENGEVYDETVSAYVTPMEFWRNYAAANGGLTWGESDQYPNYDDVNEFDLFLVQTAQGPCLMEFFHSRWRRAQDVRRWNPEFNTVLGCPYVFD